MSSERSMEYSPADENFNSFERLLLDKNWDEASILINNHKEVATMVVRNGETALHEACRLGAPLRIIDLLIRINPHAIKAKNRNGDLPLHRVALGLADPALVRRMLEADRSAAKTQNNYGDLPLHQAARNKDIPPESLKILLAAYPEGARVPECSGSLPLHEACERLLGHDNLCQILSSLMEANPIAVSTPDNDGYYPFHWMMQEIVYQLNPETMRGFEMILDAYSDVARTPCTFYNGGLPMHYLLSRPPSTTHFSELRSELVAILLKTHPGALGFPDNNGQCPLHIAVKKWPYDDEDQFLENPPPAEELADVHCQFIEALIKENSSAASIPDHEGHLALHLACMNWPSNRTNRLTALLDANKNALHHADNNGKTPLQHAFERESNADEFVYGLISVIQEVERQQFAYTNMAIQGLSVGLAGARKGLNEQREKIRSLEEENAELKAQLRSWSSV